MTQIQYTNYNFKLINPEKKYMQFSYSEAKKEHINSGYCQKGEILLIDGQYFLYCGETTVVAEKGTWIPKVYFKKGNKVLFEVNA